MLKLNTLFIGKVILSFPQLPSSNLRAQEILAKSRPIEGTVINVVQQTQGRGQIGSTWVSEAKKNLTTSIILYPKFISARKQFLLNIVVSLAVSAIIKEYTTGQKISIKWPNDIYIDNNKVAGILIQNALSGSQIQHTIIGIGLNINQTIFPENLPNPTSLKCANPIQKFDIEDVLYRLCEKLEHYYLQLKGGKAETLKEEYHENLLGFNQKRQFQKPNSDIFEGTIQGVTSDGQLILKTENKIIYFSLKEIKFLF